MERHHYRRNYSKLNWRNENFAGKVMESVDFAESAMVAANFSGADLKHINFHGADLSGANFSLARLSHVSFSGANLQGALFGGADMDNVDFNEARLQGIDLTRANLRSNIFVDSAKQFSQPTFSPDGKFLACVDETLEQVWLWPTGLNTPFPLPMQKKTRVQQRFFRPNMEFLATWDKNDLRATLWETQTDDAFWPAEKVSYEKHRLLFSPNSQLLVHATQGTIQIWDMSSQHCLTFLEVPHLEPNSLRRFPGCFSPDGRFLALFRFHYGAAEGNMSILFWDIQQQTCALALPAGYEATAFSPDGKLLATSNNTGLTLWEVTNGQHVHRIPITGTRELTFHASGQSLFVLADQLYQIDARNGNVLFPQPDIHLGHTQPVTSVVFSPDNHLLATCDKKTVEVWEIPNGKHLHSCPGCTISFSPDGAWLLTAKEMRSPSRSYIITSRVQCWSTRTWQTSKVFTTTHPVDHCFMSPDQQLLVCYYGNEKIDRTLLYYGNGEDIYDEETIYRGDITIFEQENGFRLWPELSAQLKTMKWSGTPAIWHAAFDPDSRMLNLVTEHEDDGMHTWTCDLLQKSVQQPAHEWWGQPFSLSRPPKRVPKNFSVDSSNGHWQVRTEEHHVQIWDREQQIMVARTQEQPNPATIYPDWHNRRVYAGLANPDETWQDLLTYHPFPDQTRLESGLIARKIAFEDNQQLRSAVPRGSRNSASWHNIKHQAFEPLQSMLAAVHRDGTLSLFSAATDNYYQVYWEPDLKGL